MSTKIKFFTIAISLSLVTTPIHCSRAIQKYKKISYTSPIKKYSKCVGYATLGLSAAYYGMNKAIWIYEGLTTEYEPSMFMIDANKISKVIGTCLIPMPVILFLSSYCCLKKAYKTINPTKVKLCLRQKN